MIKRVLVVATVSSRFKLILSALLHSVVAYLCARYRTTRININRIDINPNDYYNPVMDYYNPVIDYYNPVIDYYNLLLRFEPCLNLLGLILILCKININRT